MHYVARGKCDPLEVDAIHLREMRPTWKQNSGNCVWRPVWSESTPAAFKQVYIIAQWIFNVVGMSLVLKKLTMLGENHVNPTFTMQAFPQGFLNIYGWFYEYFPTLYHWYIYLCMYCQSPTVFTPIIPPWSSLLFYHCHGFCFMVIIVILCFVAHW